MEFQMARRLIYEVLSKGLPVHEERLQNALGVMERPVCCS